MWVFLASVAGHHADAASPDLLIWIKDLIDHMFSVGPWTIVLTLAALILAMPLGLMLFYFGQRRRIEQQLRSNSITKR